MTFAGIHRLEKGEQYKGKTGPKILLQLKNVASCIQANFVFLNTAFLPQDYKHILSPLEIN